MIYIKVESYIPGDEKNKFKKLNNLKFVFIML